MVPETGRSLAILRFGELWLKSYEVQRRFKDRLITNIGEMFRARGIPARIAASRDRIFLDVADADFNASLAILPRIFGLVSFSPAKRLGANRQAISDAVLDIAKKTIVKGDTFAIRVQRAGSHEFTSSEIERECGAIVVAALGNRVNLTNPDRTVYVEIRDADAFVFSEKIPAPGGLPLGAEGKLVQLPGGDLKRDAIAAYVLMKRGCRVLPVFEKGGKHSRNFMVFLEEFDPAAKPSIAAKPNPLKFAAGLCRKKKAGGIIFSNAAIDFFVRKKPKTFDKNANMPYLYPLVGFDDAEINELYASIAKTL